MRIRPVAALGEGDIEGSCPQHVKLASQKQISPDFGSNLEISAQNMRKAHCNLPLNCAQRMTHARRVLIFGAFDPTDLCIEVLRSVAIMVKSTPAPAPANVT
jgi:hypothetical protein